MESEDMKSMVPPPYGVPPAATAPYNAAPTGIPVAGQVPQQTFQQPATQVYYGQGPPPPAPPQQVAYVTQTTTSSPGAYKSMQSAIPVMPMAVAITLCIVNILLPGVGTIIASFTVFCCANVGQSGGGKFGTFCLNFWIGWLQLFTVWIFLIGWVWSIMWGIAFISAAGVKQYGEDTVVTTTTVVNSAPNQGAEQQFIQQPPPSYPSVGYVGGDKSTLQ